jgi:protein-S-isoprenylcysteine O-methyltransferase Ste14
MALIEEMDRSGNWLFRWRSFLPLLLFFGAVPVVLFCQVHWQPMAGEFDRSWWWPLICLDMAMAGQVIRALCVGYTPRGTSGRNTKEGQVAESLNTLGMYSICRHPLYLGNLLMWLGIVMYIGHVWFALVFLLLYALYYERIMFAEEQFLRGKFGKAYLDWSAGVPGFWPALGRWKEPEVPFSMRNVLKREYNGFFAVFVCFAWVDMLHGFRETGLNARFFSVPFSGLQQFWAIALAVACGVFVLLRTLKKTTKVLDVAGREYL